MASNKQYIGEAAKRLGLSLDEKKMVAYGNVKDYTIAVYMKQDGGDSRGYICVTFCASFLGTQLDPMSLQSEMNRNHISCVGEGSYIHIKIPASGNIQKKTEEIAFAVEKMCETLSAARCMNCDEKGIIGPAEVYYLQGKVAFFGEDSYKAMQAAMAVRQQKDAAVKENIPLGLVGALVGSLAGLVLMLIFGRLGRVSMISGLVMGLTVVFGYQKLGKKFSTVSAVLCVLVCAVMSYLGFRLDATIDIYGDLHALSNAFTFGYCFQNVEDIYAGGGAGGTYNTNMFMMVGMSLVSSLIIIWAEASSKKEKYELYKLGGAGR